MFLSNYLDIKLKSYEVDFAKIWNCKNGDIRQEILAHSQNMPLLGLYNIKLDVYGMKTQLVRCAIIYLCNFVMHAEYDKHDYERY